MGRNEQRHSSRDQRESGAGQQTIISHEYSTLTCAASMQRAAVDLLAEEVAEREVSCTPTRELVVLLPAMRYICEVLAAHAARERGAA